MRPLASYPQSCGARMLSVFPHRGPASYTQVTSGTAPALATGGDTVQAVEAGLKTFDAVIGGLTDSGTYRVEALPQAVSGVVGSQKFGQPSTSFRLRWTVVATGAQAAGSADLDAEIVRLTAFGN